VKAVGLLRPDRRTEMSGTVWETAAEERGPPSEGLGMRRPISLVSESHSAVFDTHNESRFATVHSSGTRETGFHPHLGRPLDEARGGPNGGGLANSHGGGRGVGGADRLLPQESAMAEEVGITAHIQRAMKQSGRMCMGVSVPGTGHTAYVFDILTTNGERWKVTRRYSDFLDLNKKLIQVRVCVHVCMCVFLCVCLCGWVGGCGFVYVYV
jgi:hypothetical protein